MRLRESVISDVRYALRLLLQTPLWTAAALLSLTLGIAVTLLIFSIIDAVLLRPFPYRDPSRLVFVWGSKDASVPRGVSGLDLVDWRARNRSFESVDAFLGQMTFTTGDGADTVAGACVGPSVLSLLGVRPALGREFVAGDTNPGAAAVAIASDGFWRTRLGASPSAIGSRLRLSGQAYQLVGVMPPGFFFPDTDSQILVPTPCGASNFWERGGAFAHAVARLRPGVSVRQADADLDRVNRDLARLYPATNKGVTAGVQPLRDIVVGKYERSLWVMLGAVMLVLVIACANVAHLQLARGMDRETELAIRATNGADRWRLFRQLLTESCVLSCLAGACALVLTWWGIGIVRSLALTDIARIDTARVSPRLAAAAALLALLSALVTGAWPSWRAAGANINDVLKAGGALAAGTVGRHVRELLAVSEIALATLLLVLAGLFVGSFVRLSAAHWGFDPNHLVLMSVLMPSDAAASPQTREQWKASLRTRVAAIEGVEAAATAMGVPIRYAWRPTRLLVQGRLADWGAAGWTIGEGYFHTMGTRILEGREFTATDDAGGAPVVVVSRGLARRLWPNASAIGQTLQVPMFRTVNGDLAPDVAQRMRRRDTTLLTDLTAYTIQQRQVIGVVEDVRAFGLDLVPDPAFYVDSRQGPAERSSKQTYLVVRTAGDGRNPVSDVKSVVTGAQFNGEIRTVDSMGDLVAHSIGGRGSNRLMMLISGLFGALSLTLTTTGIFAVMLHTVNRRLVEMGVRVALGARGRDIVRLVFAYGLRILVVGLALGTTLTWVASRYIGSLLFELEPTDLRTYTGSIATLVVAVALACLIPARRAIAFDPARLLRS